MVDFGAGWSSPVARWAHNPKVAGSNPAPATNLLNFEIRISEFEIIGGCSSVGRAHGLQPWGQGFESPHLHQNLLCLGISDLKCQISDLRFEKFVET